MCFKKVKNIFDNCIQEHMKQWFPLTLYMGEMYKLSNPISEKVLVNSFKEKFVTMVIYFKQNSWKNCLKTPVLIWHLMLLEAQTFSFDTIWLVLVLVMNIQCKHNAINK